MEVADYDKIDDPKKIIEYFQHRHESIRESWDRNKDLLISSFFVEKMQYSKNYIPYSILPFSDEVCAKIIMGRIMVRALLNISKIFHKINKAGWEIIESIFLKADDDLDKLDKEEAINIPILEIKKANYISRVPSNYLHKLIYELWSPKTMIEVLEEGYVKRQRTGYDAYLINFLDDQRIWK